jgi:hypothetical protein
MASGTATSGKTQDVDPQQQPGVLPYSKPVRFDRKRFSQPLDAERRDVSSFTEATTS